MTVLRRIAEGLAGLRRTSGTRPKPKARPRSEPGPVHEIDPTLPATAQVVAIQHPSATLPERPYDLVLLAAVLGLLGDRHDRDLLGDRRRRPDAVRQRGALPRAPDRVRRARRRSRCGSARAIDYRRLRAGRIRCCWSRSLLLGVTLAHAGAQRREAVDPARAADVPAGRDREARARHVPGVLARPQGGSGQDVHRRLRPAPRRVRR